MVARQNPNHSRVKGLSLTEYGLVVGLVAVAGVASLTTLGSIVQRDLGGMITQRPPAQATPTGPAIINANAGGSTPIAPSAVARINVSPGGIGGVIASPAQGQEKLCFGSGLCANIPVITEQTRPDVSGGNGGQLTHQFANTLRQIAQQIEAEGTDPDLANLISQLANQGHGIGNLQDSVSNQCGIGLSGARITTDPPGKCTRQMEYTGDQSDPSKGSIAALKTDFQTKLGSVLNQLQNYPGPLKEDVAFIIESQSKQILTLADGFNSTVTINPKGKVKMITTTNNAVLIHQSANTICDQGGRNCQQQP